MVEKTKTKIDSYSQWFQERIDYVRERGFVIVFCTFCVYFIYSLAFIDEADRLSNETICWGLFISTLFAFLAHLTLS